MRLARESSKSVALSACFLRCIRAHGRATETVLGQVMAGRNPLEWTSRSWLDFEMVVAVFLLGPSSLSSGIPFYVFAFWAPIILPLSPKSMHSCNGLLISLVFGGIRTRGFGADAWLHALCIEVSPQLCSGGSFLKTEMEFLFG